jgi:hypothetical protein
MEVAARMGWVARGVLYALVAMLVVGIPSAGGGDRSADKKGAFEALATKPYGSWLLAAVIVGMLGFAAWRAWSAVRGTEEKATRRLSWVGSAVVYVGLATLAIGVLRSGDSGGNQEKAITARILEWPAGPVIVGAVALAILATAANHLRKGIKKRFLRDIDEGDVPDSALPAVRTAGVLGLFGRALVWGLVGWFLLRVAVQHDPSEPVGLDESLRRLAEESWGTTVLWAAVAGLFAYAVLCGATAMWPDPEPDS